ncbi:MAG TPA: DUF6370 family protein [Gemmataceae bacterium]|nr:DUF6370 family protein [Gemmataceae bacterium]
MRTAWSVALALVAGGVFVGGLRADDKEVTLKGTILCAKCALKESKKCQTAIQVKEDGKTVTYYLDDKGMKEEYHEEVCGGARKEGTVTGTVHEHDGKKFIKPTKVEYAKKQADHREGNDPAPQAASCCTATAQKAQPRCCCCGR